MTHEEQTSVEDGLNMAIERQRRFKRQLTRLERALGVEPNEQDNIIQDTDNLDNHTG